MSLFANVKQANNVVQEEDKLGGGFNPLESGIYTATISHAYVSESQRGALAVNFEFDIDGHKLNETMYVTNANKANTYKDKTTGENKYLPSFITANDIALITTSQELFDLGQEDKVLNLYDFAQGKKVPSEVPVITDMTGKKVKLAVLKETVDKTAKNDSGDYVPTGETRVQNSIAKVFHPTKDLTVNEARAGSEANFINQWADKYAGQTIDKSKGVKGSSKTGATKKPASSLFAS